MINGCEVMIIDYWKLTQVPDNCFWRKLLLLFKILQLILTEKVSMYFIVFYIKLYLIFYEIYFNTIISF